MWTLYQEEKLLFDLNPVEKGGYESWRVNIGWGCATSYTGPGLREYLTDEAITVPAGSFLDAMFLRGTMEGGPDTFAYWKWFARDIGLVKQKAVARTDLSLKEASVNGVMYPKNPTTAPKKTWGGMKLQPFH